ncbi:hypothetical protein V2G26_005058 [Clonostachys chloroleuca]
MELHHREFEPCITFLLRKVNLIGCRGEPAAFSYPLKSSEVSFGDCRRQKSQRTAEGLGHKPALSDTSNTLAKREDFFSAIPPAMKTLLGGPHMIDNDRKRQVAISLMRRAYEEYSLKDPRPASLPFLVRLNLLNALASNAYKIDVANSTQNRVPGCISAKRITNKSHSPSMDRSNTLPSTAKQPP